ncbi:hypothetical protein DSM106972_016620 [Dulcicalothrix desertica PCC 7102]|uniref:Uncharacterized protein n=1 Tax=Dulcicalothrix desertica PCC 7102 TaxID=232991 RepID=A0A433VQX1_9CYAN|nr:transcriptional regulator [Dulcicalothrix desertica]RUT08494.1 hypothetical protein DSM106972_016620 [Dulcicalothrix desertica PCC 7102]
MIELRPIKTEADYRAALSEIEVLFDVQPNTPECDRLNILATLVEAIEVMKITIMKFVKNFQQGCGE